MSSLDLKIEVSPRDGVQQHIAVSGELGEDGAEELGRVLAQIDLRGIQEVDIDISCVTRVGSAGIGIILALYKQLVVHGARLRLSRTPENIRQLLGELNLNEIVVVD